VTVVRLVVRLSGIAVLLAGCASDAQGRRAPEPPGRGATAGAENVQVALGVPSDADPSDDTVVDEGDFVVSYNPRRHAPNWVAWKLEASDLGHAHRKNAFHADERLPSGVYRATPHDFAHSGYDRGHLCPFGDRNATPESGAQTFSMTNMAPQLHELNAGPWKALEAYERDRASDPGFTLYLVAGGVYDENPPVIGHGIAVPRATFKIVVLLHSGQRAREVTELTPTLAVEMPNEHGVGGRDWTDFVTSIDRVEEDTGYDFLSDVPADVQTVIEARAPRRL
jgi:endonuclease G